MAINWFAGATDSPWVNWYMPRPVRTVEEAEQDVPASDIIPVEPVYYYPPVKQGGEREDPAFDPNASPVAATRAVDLDQLGYINVADIQFSGYNDFLNTKGIPDRSGVFSKNGFSMEGTDVSKLGPEFSTPKRGEKVGSLALALTGNPFVGLAGSLLGSNVRTITDPTGQFPRAIQESGFGNVMATMSIAQEYDGLGKIRDAWNKNPNGTPVQNGLAFSLGNNIIWREPDSDIYKGLEGTGINQKTAKGLGDLILGREVGKGVVDTMVNDGIITDGYTVDELYDNTGVSPIISTKNGGYLLDGSFNFKGRKSPSGRYEDLQGMADTVFNGNMGVATDWMNSARSTKFESVTEQLANLQYFMDLSRGISKEIATLNRKTVLNGATAPTATKTQSVTAENSSAKQEAERDETEKNIAKTGAIGSAARAGQVINPFEQQGHRGGGGGSKIESGRGQTFSEKASSGRGYKIGAEGGAVDELPRKYAEGDLIVGDQSTSAGDPIISQEELASGPERSGFIERPPSQVSDQESVADDKPTNADTGGFIINEAAVSEAGEMDIAKMISKAENYARQNGIEPDPNQPTEEILTSAGEVYIEPHLRSIIGEDVLRKINNRGKPKTRKKIQQAKQQGFVERV